jgi:hypothetical protein
MDETHIRFTNWERYQHYKRGRGMPPWVKLHNGLLESESFNSLPEQTQAHVVKLLLLASRKQNAIKANASYIRDMIHARSPVNIDAIVTSGICEYFCPASTTLASCAQDARAEGEEEAETEEDPSSTHASKLVADGDLSDIAKVVNACRYAFPNGMFGVGPSQQQKVRELIGLAGGAEQARLLLSKSADKRAPLEYALGIAKNESAKNELQANQPKRKYLTPEDVANER